MPHHQSPNESRAHQILRAKCVEVGIPEAHLRNLLWQINADDALTCFAPICQNLSNICRLMDEHFAAYCVEHQIAAGQWMNIANWVVADVEKLTEAIGEQFNQWPERPDENALLGDGMRVGLINPLIGRCAARNSVYTVLLNTLASEDDSECDRFSLMVGQLLVAHVHVCREYVPLHKYENYAGSGEIAGYPNTPYTASHALRVISGQEKLSFCPSWLDPGQAPQQFAEAAKLYKSEGDVLSIHLAGYCRIIARAHGLLGWSTRAGGGGGKNGGGKWIPGYVRLGPDCEIVPTQVGDPDDPHEDWGKQVVITEATENGEPITQNRARQLLAEDIDPSDLASEDELCLTEYPCHETNKGTAGFVFAAKGQARHVVMEHQLLPWHYRMLTVTELASLLTFCSDLFRKLQRAKKWSTDQTLLAETIAILHTMLWTGSTLDRAKKLQILPGAKELAKSIYCELGLYIPAPATGSKIRLVEWRIGSYFPDYRVTLEAPPGVTRRRTSYMYVPDIAGGAQFIRLILKKRGPGKRRTFFTKGIDEYRRALRKLLKSVDASGRITEQKIVSYLFHRIACITDVTQAVAITGREHELARTRIYYTTPQLKVLREAYVKALWDIVPFVYKAAGRKLRLDYAAVIDPTVVHVGSRLCPTREAAKKAIAKLQKAIKKAVNYRTWDEFVVYHNYFTLYTVLMVGYATSCRAIISPFLATSEIDADTGLAALADKDGPDHHKSRLVWVPEEVRRQIRGYEAHRQALLGSLHGHFAKSDAVVPDCFFLRVTDRGQFAFVAVRPSTLSKQMKGFIRLPANVHRRFLRTELIEDGCPAEVIDAFMGHWSRGEEPFGWFSSFSFQEHVTTLESHLVPLLKDLGWQPIESALT